MKKKKDHFQYAEWETRVTSVLKGEELLRAYETEWSQNKIPPLNCTILNRMIFGEEKPLFHLLPSRAFEIISEHVRTNLIARECLNQCIEELCRLVQTHGVGEYLRILMLLKGVDEISSALHGLISNLPIAKRANLLRSWVLSLTWHSGRKRTKQLIKLFWQEHPLLEEEKETLIRTALEEHVYDWQTLPSLSSEARSIAITLLSRADISPAELGPFLSADLINLQQHGTRPDPVVQKVTSLAQQAVVPTRLAGAGLKPQELDRVGLAWLHPILSVLAFKRYRRLFHHPIIEELLHMWGREWPSLLHLNNQGPTGANGFRMLGIPLVRLLHMRLVLEAPFLSSALANPESSLAPEVLLFLLGQEGVTYSPEITLPAGAAPGWRRRWAESTGEALSSLFLEDALRLDLTTLFRLPESRDEKTPDFGAKTFAGEQIVFESKGATSWDSFCKSKRKALRQLAKDGPTTSWQQSFGWSRKARGRAFACCLFCTSGSETESSQFHVEDPPFAFAGVFHEGWESSARRRHYGAVLQAAGLYPQATAVLEGDSFEVANNLTQERSLELPDGEPAKFVGRSHDLSDLAIRLGHPQPGPFEKVKVFVGIEKELLSALSHQELPSGSPFGIEANEDFATSKIPSFGLLPGQNPNAAARGVFSRLSNGSYLAVSVGEE